VRKWFKRLAVSAAAGLLLLALGGAWVAHRAGQTPQWYQAAVECSVEPAQVAEHTQLIGFQNWLARSGAGNPDQIPSRNRQYEITLTEEQINALLAKWTDNLHNDVELLRVHLGDDEMTVQGTWTARGRTVGLHLKTGPATDGRPSLWIDSVRVGDQGVPLSWVNSTPIDKLQTALKNLAASEKRVAIDEHGIASPQVARICTTASALSLAQGYAIEPTVFVSPRLSIEDTIPLNVIAARADGKTLSLTFQLLTPSEQQDLIDHTNAIIAQQGK